MSLSPTVSTSVVNPSAFGTWIVNKVSSDFLPPVQRLSEAPISASCCGDTDELVITARHDIVGVEELLLTHRSQGIETTRIYQLGKLNIEKYSSDVILGIVVAVTNECESFVIVRYGPGASSQSSERFSIDPSNSILKVEIDVVLSNGTVTKSCKYFKRRLPGKNISPRSITPERCITTFGWLYQEYRAASMLPEATVQVIDAWTVIAPRMKLKGSANGVNKHLAEGLQLTRSIDNKVTDGESVIVFLIQIDLMGRSWFVVHRYKEFDALRLFINARKHLRSERYWGRVGTEPQFPRKRAFSIQLSVEAYPQYIRDRITGLEAFLNYHIALGGHEIQSVVDIIASFLEIPEHLKSAEEAVRLSMQDIRGSVAVEGGAAAVRGNGNGRIFAAITRRSSDAGSDAALKKRVSLVGGTSSIESSQRDDASHNNSNMNKNNIIQHLAVTSNNLANMLKISTAKDFVGLSTVSPLVIPSDTCYKYPQDALYAVLSVGLIVIKHGRQGKPKKRLLRCDTGMLRLYWGEVPDTKALKSTIADVAQDLPSENKSIELLEAIEVRRATEEDSDDVSTVAGTAVTSGPGTASAAAAGKYGTKILRRNKLKPEELSLSFSIILKDRSFDIQCLNEADFRFLYINILHYWKMMSNK